MTRAMGGYEQTYVDHGRLCKSSSSDGSGRSQFFDLYAVETEREGEGSELGQGAESIAGHRGSYDGRRHQRYMGGSRWLLATLWAAVRVHAEIGDVLDRRIVWE
jgi:hypothetical protein